MEISKKEIYEERAKIFKALGHPTRLWIVEKLESGECCVCEFVDRVDADFSTISKHLSVLKNAGIVTSEKRGKQVFYRLNVPCIFKFMECAEAVISGS